MQLSTSARTPQWFCLNPETHPGIFGTGQGIRHFKLEESVNMGPDLCRKSTNLVGLANVLTVTTTAVVAAVVVAAVAGSGSSICVACHVHARTVCMML